MELTQLHYFLTVANLEHVSNASKKLNIAQPALTKAIHNLEQELGIKLFEQNGRNIRLTKWGLWLKEQIESPVSSLLSIPNTIKVMQETNIITISLDAATMFVTDVIIKYQQRNKNVRFKISQNNAYADIKVTTSLDKINEYSYIEKIYLATSIKNNIKIKSILDLKNETFVSFTESKSFRGICDSFINSYFQPNVGFECDNVAAVHNLIASNNGIGFWPEYSWGFLANDIKLISLDKYSFVRYINVQQSNNSIFNQDVVNDFFSYLNECFKEKRIL